MKKHRLWIIILSSFLVLVCAAKVVIQVHRQETLRAVQEQQEAMVQTVAEQSVWALPLANHAGTYSGMYSGNFLSTNESGTFLCDLRGNVRPLNSQNGGFRLWEHGILEQQHSDGSKTYSYLGVVDIPHEIYAYDEKGENQSAHKVRLGRDVYWSYLNQQQIAIAPQPYAAASDFWNGYAVVEQGDGTLYIYIINQAFETVPVSWEALCAPNDLILSEGYALLEHGSDGERYFLNVLTNEYFPLEGYGYEDARPFSEGLAAVCEDGLWGYVDTSGRFVIDPQYRQAFDFSDGMAAVWDSNGSCWMIDRQNRRTPVALESAQWIGAHHDGLFIAEIEPLQYRLLSIDPSRNPPAEMFNYWDFQDGIWILGADPFENGAYFPEADRYTAGIGITVVYHSAVKVDTLQGSILFDKSGNLELCRYGRILAFREGLALYYEAETGTYGFIDTSGNVVVELGPVSASDFFQGVSYARFENATGLLANPLLYSEWSVEELERADELGLPVFEQSAPLRYETMWEGLTVFAQVYHKAQETFAMEDPETYEISIADLRARMEQAGFPVSGTVDRQHLAMALMELSREYGSAVDCFVPLYTDNYEIDAGYEDAMGYACALCLFDLDDSGGGFPDKSVSERELTSYLLRYFEALI